MEARLGKNINGDSRDSKGRAIWATLRRGDASAERRCATAHGLRRRKEQVGGASLVILSFTHVAGASPELNKRLDNTCA